MSKTLLANMAVLVLVALCLVAEEIAGIGFGDLKEGVDEICQQMCSVGQSGEFDYKLPFDIWDCYFCAGGAIKHQGVPCCQTLKPSVIAVLVGVPLLVVALCCCCCCWCCCCKSSSSSSSGGTGYVAAQTQPNIVLANPAYGHHQPPYMLNSARAPTPVAHGKTSDRAMLITEA